MAKKAEIEHQLAALGHPNNHHGTNTAAYYGAWAVSHALNWVLNKEEMKPPSEWILALGDANEYEKR